MMRGVTAGICTAALCLLLGAAPIGAQENDSAGAEPGKGRESAEQAAQAALARAEGLYKAGDYTACEEIVDQTVAALATARGAGPRRILARLRILEALLVYTFRDEGYEQEVARALGDAVALDLNVDVGNPAEVPPFILDSFARIRKAYLARFTRSARRNTFGLVGALVLEPTVFTDFSVLQPGVFYSFNFNDRLTLDAELRVPLRTPVWNSIRGQVGLIWYPSFRVETLSMGISTTYLFGLDNLSAYTHSLSIGGQGEIVSRSGFGIGANVEMLRVDLLFGFPSSELPSYRAIPFLANLVRLAFANIRMFAFWTF
jgi:hypothetical protein